MEITKEQQEEHKKRLLDTFRRTIDFLNKHNFQWWVAYGTAIGTVRHKGIIPWDDDIDIYMPWDDYCRLLEYTKEFEGTNLALDKPFTENNICPYAKIYDTNSTVWQVEDLKSIIGLWVDIFPLFKTNALIDDYWNYTKKYKLYTEKYIGGKQGFSLSKPWFYFKSLQLNNFIKWIRNMTIYKVRKQKKISNFKQYLDSIHDKNGNKYMFPFTYGKSVNLYPIEWFEETEELPFEDFKVKIMSGYDKLLTQVYGDYMTLPPLEMRFSHHSYYFISLNHKYALKEIEDILSRK